MTNPPSKDYVSAFENHEEPFLSYYYYGNGKEVRTKQFTRGEFMKIAHQATSVMNRYKLVQRDCVIHLFGSNDYRDLAFRLSSVLKGVIPVTVNWQADNFERVCYKIELTQPKLIVFSTEFDTEMMARLREKYDSLPFYDVEMLEKEDSEEGSYHNTDLNGEDTRIIIFTSGTTGDPKGVKLPYRAYDTNRMTFETMMMCKGDDKMGFLVTNPMHHTNSTAITDWAMRRSGSHLHLVQRYSTNYWTILANITSRGYDRIIAPMVSRHFDFLDNLASTGKLPLPLSELQEAMNKIDFLIGSAPVGPTTVVRLKKYAGRLPTVRFGSTETCLQVIGISSLLTEEQCLEIFKTGWNHSYEGRDLVGYYIGRPTRPYTEARIVESIDPADSDYFKDCPVGKPGYLVTRGNNLMTEYVNNPKATASAFHEDGWYTGLKDICFALENSDDGELDFFWQGRDSFLMIRGGANYAFDQINMELTEFIKREYSLDISDFEVAVVGMRIESEHEDDCCVTIELKSDKAIGVQSDLENTFIDKAKESVTKGAKPNYLRFGQIPKNFKGALLVPELKKAYEDFLENLSD